MLEPRLCFSASPILDVSATSLFGALGSHDISTELSSSLQQLGPDSIPAADSFHSTDFLHAKPQQQELIVLDSRVPDLGWFREQFAERLRSGSAELLFLSREDDAIASIGEQLAKMSDVRAVHLISHGDEGSLWLGRDVVDSSVITDRLDDLQAIGKLLAEDADLLLYGCEVGQGDVGREFLQLLSDATGMDVAASDGITGSTELGGDWDLEIQVGNIATAAYFDASQIQNWRHTLDTATVTLYFDSTAAGSNTSTLDAAAPTSTPASVPDFDGSDGNPGRLFEQTTDGLAETDSDAIHAWKYVHTGQQPLHLNGAASMQVFAALENFMTNRTGALQAWLVDVDALGNTVAQIATDTVTRNVTATGFTAFDFNFGTLNYMLATGHSLQVKMVSPEALSQRDMWVAYDTLAQPSRLTFTAETGFGKQNPSADAYTILEDSTLNVSGGFPVSGWQARRQITFNNGMRSQALNDFPVLVTLDATKIDYNLTQNNGNDLRFVDADGTLLDHEVENWDESGVSRVWVRVPTISASSNADFIWMYYGNDSAVDGQNSTGVWSSSYDAVYHLNEAANADGDVLSDSTANGFHGTNLGSTDATGPAGNGQSFDGINDRIDLGGNRAFVRQASGATLSAWIAPDVVTGIRHIVGVSHATDPRYSRAVIEVHNSEIRVYGRSHDTGFNILAFATTITSPLTAGAWHHVAATINYASNSIQIFVDGVQQSALGFPVFLATATPDTNPMAASIGAEENGTGLFFDGKLDEVRIERTVRSAEWVSAQYASATGTLLNFNAEERNTGVMANDANLDWETTIARITSTTTNGSLTFQSNGSFQYTPNANYNGGDRFEYEIVSASGISTKGTVTLTVLPVNDNPVGTNDTYVVAEGGTLNDSASGVLANDSDPDGDALNAVLSAAPIHGTLTLRADGSFDYVHDGSETTTDSFTYFTRDTSNATSGLIQVNITINPVDDAPIVSAVNATVAEGGVANINVQSTIVDPDGRGPYTTQLVGGASNGTVSINGSGRIIYRHDGSETTTDTVRFRVRDAAGVFSNTQTITIRITPVNDAPIANSNAISTNEDTPVIISEASLLGNDSDADGDTLQVTGITNSGGGALVNNGNGTWTYTPAANFFGGITLRYQIQDGNGGTASADLVINVAPVNDAPSVSNLSRTLNEGDQITIDPSGVISDIDGSSPFSRIITRGPTNGTLTIDQNGRFVYRHNGSETTTDSAEFRVRDAGGALSGTAQLTFTIVPQNDSPIATLDSLAGLEDTLFNFTSAMLLANDSDPEGDSLSVTSVTSATGTITNNGNGNWTYAPAANANGPVDLTYRIADGQGGTATGIARLSIAAVNDAPVATNDLVTTQEDTILAPGRYRLMSNDNDVDGNSLTANLVTNVSQGTLTLNSDGTFNYMPTANFFGTDFFEYRVSDGQLSSATARVTIQVQSVNDAPTTIAMRVSVNEGGMVSRNYLVGRASDIEGDPLIISSAQTPAHGSVTWNANGSFQYTHDGGEDLADTISFQISDGNGGTAIGIVNLDIQPVNDAPLAVADRFDVTPNGRLVVTSNGVLANDVEPDGNGMQVHLVSGPTSGLLLMQPNGLFEYVPDAGFVGVDSFTYTATDGQLTGSPTTVTLVVLAPQGSNGSATGSNVSSGNSNSASTPAPASPSPVPPSAPARPTVIPLVDLRAVNDGDNTESNADEGAVDSNRSTTTNQPPGPQLLVASLSDQIFDGRDGLPGGSAPLRSENDGFRNHMRNDSLPTIGKIELSSLEVSAPLAVIIQSLATEIDSLQEDLSTSIAAAGVVTGGILVATSTVSVGYVFWALRTGFLMASVLSSLPAWQSFDPVPLINHLDDEGEFGDEDDAVERMMGAR
jgi:VCBS repeat-containing protein